MKLKSLIEERKKYEKFEFQLLPIISSSYDEGKNAEDG
jgi:hypothetical protein